ncbi:MAG: insulinase family protein [Lachnospiraceae bacterium]|nr:insulinase family protein [Lachnospiraceae bacterium]
MVKQYQLCNGIRVVCEQVDYAHSVALGVWIRTGSAYETAKNNGIAHMAEHMLFKRTERRTARQIADETADIGGNLDACTSKEFTSYYVWVLKENLAQSIDLLGDMLTNSLFLDEDLEKEKDIVMEEIDMYKDSPEDVVHEMLQKSLWKDHPLGYLISGERETVESFTGEDLRKFVKEHYTAENTVISVAGNVSFEEIREQLAKAFGGIARAKKIHRLDTPLFTPCVYLEEKDIEQVHINLAYDSITSVAEERYAFSVLNAILGGGVNSRLFLKVREELGLAYSVYSYGSTFQKAGLFHMYAGLNANQLEPAIEAMGQELRLLKRELPEEEEIARAREQIKTDLIIQGENIRGRMNSNAKELMLFDRVISLEDTLDMINRVHAAELEECLKKWFDRDRMAFAVAGNLEEMPESLRSLDNLKSFF